MNEYPATNTDNSAREIVQPTPQPELTSASEADASAQGTVPQVITPAQQTPAPTQNLPMYVPAHYTAPTYGAPTYGAPPAPANSVDSSWNAVLERREKAHDAVNKAAHSISAGIFIPATLVLGMLYSALVMRSETGVGLTAVIALFYALYTALIAKPSENKSFVSSVALGLPVLLLSASFAYNSSLSGRFIIHAALILLFIMQLTGISGCTDAKRIISGKGAADSLYTFFIAPFSNMKSAFSGLFIKDKPQKGSRLSGTVGKVLLGLLISLPVAIVLILLLAGADAVFSDFNSRIASYIDSLDIQIGTFVVDLIHGVLFSLFVIPLVVTLRAGNKREAERKALRKWLDPVIAATVSYVSAAIFVVFVVIQISYFFPVSLSYFFKYDFSRKLVLPNNMTWAEYARSGFFELSSVIIASFIAILFFMKFSKLNDKGELPGYLKTALTVISVCNIIMCISAVLRMGLYTVWCGLTAKRVGVLFIIAVMAVSLAAITVKLWFRKISLFRVVGIASICAVTCFGCMNIDRICAEVNVYRHLEQDTTIDVSYLGELSYGAAPAVYRLSQESPDEDVRAAAQGLLAKYYFEGQGLFGDGGVSNYSLGSITYDRLAAEKLCLDDNGETWLDESMIPDYEIYAEWQDFKNYYERADSDEYMSFDEYKEYFYGGEIYYEYE